ncbi:MAG: DUF4440 domain-containing protein [Saprospiraceae bacterium]|nr:DUF4440 domain-containing protein [Saprospiraceae bacterium]
MEVKAKLKFVFLFLGVLNIQFVQAQDNNHEVRDFFDLYSESTIIAGHRGGYYTEFPENSLSIFEYIVSKVSTKHVMLEVDVRKDKDGNLWLMHDSTLDRTTTINGPINTTSTRNLNNAKLKDQTGKPTSESVPTFEDFLNWTVNNTVFIILDIKDDSWKEALTLIRKKNLENRCIVLTFTPETLSKVYNLNQDIFISTLINESKDWENLNKSKIPKSRLVAYISEKTPKNLIGKLRTENVLILSDSREVWKGQLHPMSSHDYRTFTGNYMLNILITDFPTEVSSFISDFQDTLKLIKTINDLHIKKFRWMEQKQMDSLSLLLDDGVYYIHSNGWKETKDEVLENIQSGKLTYRNVRITDSDVRLIDNTAIVTGKGIFSVSMDDKPIEINLYYTEVYVIKAEGIRLVSRHACKI